MKRQTLGIVILVPLLFTSASCGIVAKRISSNKAGQSEDSLEGVSADSAYSESAEAKVQADISYGSDKQQKLDIYTSKTSGDNKKLKPIFFMVHGGAWMVGDKKNSAVVENKIKKFVAEGAVLVSINYRMSFSPNPLQQVEDVDAALAYVAKNAQKFGADPKRIVIAGHSAGAHLVSLYSSDKSFQKADVPFLGTISLDSAAFDLEKIMSSKHYGFYDRVFGDDPDNWRRNSPTQRLSQKIKPMMIVCSTKRSDSCPQAEEFAAKAMALGSSVRIHKVDLTHKEVNQQLGLTSDYTEAVTKFLQDINW